MAGLGLTAIPRSPANIHRFPAHTYPVVTHRYLGVLCLEVNQAWVSFGDGQRWAIRSERAKDGLW